jgi:hypothetical protein
MPPFLTVASRMDIKYFPRNPALRAKTTGSWNDIGVWYANLTSASRVPSPALQQRVTELTAGISDPLKKMQVLAAYVQQQIRYVAIEIGIGGLQSHPAADVFKHQYGDCKDKATLLGTMLKVAGIDSYYVMIDTARGIVNPDFPSLRGNHMIMAIRLPQDVTANTLYAFTLPWTIRNSAGSYFLILPPNLCRWVTCLRSFSRATAWSSHPRAAN